MGSCAPQLKGFWTSLHAAFPSAPMVSPKVTMSSPLCSNATGTSSPKTSALVNVLLAVATQDGLGLVMVASQATQSQSPFTWYSLTEDPGSKLSAKGFAV